LIRIALGDMSNAERTILVAVIAGAVAIGLYIRERHQNGNLAWDDIWPIAGIAAGLVAFVAVLVMASPWIVAFAIPALALVAGTYLPRESRTRNTNVAGWALIVVATAGWLSQIIRVLLL
jgi:hypothetical protein